MQHGTREEAEYEALVREVLPRSGPADAAKALLRIPSLLRQQRLAGACLQNNSAKR